MGAYGKILRSHERSDLQRLLPQPACHRRDSAVHHAHRLAPPSPEFGFFISFAAPLETGWEFAGFLLVVMLLSHCIRRSSGCHLARHCHLR